MGFAFVMCVGFVEIALGVVSIGLGISFENTPITIGGAAFFLGGVGLLILQELGEIKAQLTEK